MREYSIWSIERGCVKRTSEWEETKDNILCTWRTCLARKWSRSEGGRREVDLTAISVYIYTSIPIFLLTVSPANRGRCKNTSKVFHRDVIQSCLSCPKMPLSLCMEYPSAGYTVYSVWKYALTLLSAVSFLNTTTHTIHIYTLYEIRPPVDIWDVAFQDRHLQW